jgi:hypothetical protein
MRSGAAPSWARALVLAVCTEADVAPPDVLRWRRLERQRSSGVANRHARSIAVTAGTDAADARHTLIHELAHWLAPEERRTARRGRSRRRTVVHHGRTFYRIAIDLFARYEPPLGEALEREALRYPTCLRHAVALGVSGASQLAADRRRAMRTRRAAGAWRVLVPEHAVMLARAGRWYVCAACGRRLEGRVLVRAARRGRRERHTLWTRQPETIAG